MKRAIWVLLFLVFTTNTIAFTDITVNVSGVVQTDLTHVQVSAIVGPASFFLTNKYYFYWRFFDAVIYPREYDMYFITHNYNCASITFDDYDYDPPYPMLIAIPAMFELRIFAPNEFDPILWRLVAINDIVGLKVFSYSNTSTDGQFDYEMDMDIGQFPFSMSESVPGVEDSTSTAVSMLRTGIVADGSSYTISQTNLPAGFTLDDIEVLGGSHYTKDVANSQLVITPQSGESYSVIFHHTDDSTLPVDLLLFDGFDTVHGIELNWQTESEINNLGFILERTNVNKDKQQEIVFLQWETIASYEKDSNLTGWGTSVQRKSYSFLDVTAKLGQCYKYRLSSQNVNGTTHYYDVISVTRVQKPETTELFPAYPNPFNPGTKLTYQLADAGEVNISVYDMLGRRVATIVDEAQAPGQYNIYWHGKDDLGQRAATGAFMIVLETGETVKTQKVVMVK